MKRAFLTTKEIETIANALVRYQDHRGEWADDLFDVVNGDWWEKMMAGSMKISPSEYRVFEKIRGTSFEEKFTCKDGYKISSDVLLQYGIGEYTRNGKKEYYIRISGIEDWMRFVEVNAMMRLMTINWRA